MTTGNTRKAALLALALAAVTGTWSTLSAQAPGGGQREGIVVHGHWTIDIKESDGRLVSHREFENALMSPSPLNGVLSRATTIGEWRILLADSNATTSSPCSASGPCLLLEPGHPAGPLAFQYQPSATVGDPNVFQSLTVPPIGITSTSPAGLSLNATATASRAGQIAYVQTRVISCPSTVSSSDCANPAIQPLPSTYMNPFSGTTLASPIAVVAGQIIQVTVTFTFS